jgi:hypothetical protein
MSLGFILDPFRPKNVCVQTTKESEYAPGTASVAAAFLNHPVFAGVAIV